MPASPQKLRVTLGYFLDGNASPGPVPTQGVRLDSLVLGPFGFLNFLMIWLGLPPADPSDGNRVAACLRAARECVKEDGDTFYAEALDRAPWPTAKRLLAIRDDLVLNGFSPEIGGTACRRINDFAALERRMPVFNDLSFGLQSVLKTLEKWPLPQALEVELIEPSSLWPSGFQKLFTALKEREVSFIECRAEKCSYPDNNLGRVQTFLERKTDPVPCAGADDSLIVLRTPGIDEAAECVAQLLPFYAEQGRTVLLRQRQSLPLEEALARYHQPTTGYARESPGRSILQVLPIALRMLWKPRSMQTLLDFLLLPVSPVPKGASGPLVKALREFPGIGNEVWNTKCDEARDKVQENYGEKAGDIWKDFMAFIEPSSLADEREGMGLSQVEDVCDRVIAWAKISHKNPANRPLKSVLARQADELRSMARESGETRFSRPTLESMLEYVSFHESSVTAAWAQASPWDVIGNPGQLHGKTDTLIWYCFEDAQEKAHHFWSKDEIQDLEKNGVNLPPMRARHELSYQAYRRAVSLVSRRLVLVLPSFVNGEEMAPHRLMDFIAPAFGDTDALMDTLARSADDMLKGLPRETDTVERREPPSEPKEPVQLGEQPLPEEISFTLADNSVKCPFQGLLKTGILRISGVEDADLPNIDVILGKFSHYVLQKILKEGNIHGKDLGRRAVELIEALVETHAAVLREPHLAVDYNAFKECMAQVAQSLSRHLGNDATKVETEKVLHEAEVYEKTDLCGRADVYVEKTDDSCLIWDLKWSSLDSYRKLLTKGKAYQLAAYAQMAKKPAHVAYWLLKADDFFGTPGSGAESPPRPSETIEVDMAQTWKDFLEDLREVFETWKAGFIPVGMITDKKNDKYSGCKFCELSFVCGRGYGDQ